MERIVLPHKFNYAESQRIKNTLKMKYPFLVTFSAGKSNDGRDITTYTLGNYKNTVLFTAGFCKDESLNGLLLLRFLENICESLKKRQKLSGVDISSAFMSKGITLIPCLNPDNTETDLICNFTESDNSSAYALKKLTEKLPVSHALAFHSWGERIFWSRGNSTPRNSLTMANIFSVCSGYTPQQESNDEKNFKNWFIDSFGKSAFTIATVKESPEMLDELYDKLEEMLVIAAII